MTDVFNRFDGARSVYGMKKPVRAASTGNLTLSGFQTVDSVVFASTDEAAGYNMRCLAKDQTDTTANGVYIVQSGDWARDKDFDGNTDYTRGTSVFVTEGTVNSGRLFTVSSADPQSIGINATSYQRFGLDHVSKHGDDVASSGTINLDATTGEIVDVSGTTTITAITLANGRVRVVRFTGALTLTHSASLVLPGAQNIPTASGDCAIFVGYASSVVRCVSYTRAAPRMLSVNVTPVSTPTSSSGSTAESNLMTYSLPADTLSANGFGIKLTAWGVTAATTTAKQVKAYFGATAIADTGFIALNNHSWRFEGNIIRSSTVAQVAHSLITASSATILPAISQLSTPGEILSSAITVKITGLCTSTAASAITANGMTVEFLPAL